MKLDMNMLFGGNVGMPTARTPSVVKNTTRFVVYGYRSLQTGEIFYIGSGSISRYKDKSCRVTGCVLKENDRYARWFEYTRSDQDIYTVDMSEWKPTYEKFIIEELSDRDTARLAERQWIQYYYYNGEPLLNKHYIPKSDE